jgi:hypothetical protein
VSEAIVKTERGLILPEGLKAQQESALAQCALLNACDTTEQQAEIVRAQQELKGVINALNKAREAAKRPLIDAGRALDAFVRSECSELESEGMRLARLVSEFQELQRVKAAAAKAAADKEAQELERLKHQMLAQVNTVEEADAIHEDFSRRTAAAQEAAQMAAPVHAKGQVVRDDWEITVVNEFELAKYHPQCVTITPKMLEIKSLLNQFIDVHGIRAKKKLNSGVRATRAIDV